MGIARYRSVTISEPKKWHGDEASGYWVYGDYRCCYLTIRKLDNNKYRPGIGSETNIGYPGKDLPSSGRFEYNTFEEAEKHLYEYVDYIRDVHDGQAKKDLQLSMHKLRPNVYPL